MINMINWQKISLRFHEASVGNYSIIVHKSMDESSDLWMVSCVELDMYSFGLGYMSLEEAKQKACKIIEAHLATQLHQLQQTIITLQSQSQ